ncbi:MAG: flagellar export protein FliJ [Candidatus Brocadiia bacterium]
MRRFRFPLAGLLKLLAHREDEAKLRLAQAAEERRRAAGVLEHLERQVGEARQEHRRRRSQGATRPREEALYQDYFARMEQALDQRRQERDRAAAQHHSRRRELREAATRHRLIALLRERRLDEHRRVEARELTRKLDEAGARRFHYPGPGDRGGPGPAA